MRFALLFNSAHPALGNYYGLPIRTAILSTGILQEMKESSRVAIGDIITSHGSSTEPNRQKRREIHKRVLRSAYSPGGLDLLIRDRLEKVIGRTEIFCWLFVSIREKTARRLHDGLRNYQFYVGGIELDYTNPAHLVCYRNSLPEFFRLGGGRASFFFSMGNKDSVDEAIMQEFKEAGLDIHSEDIGMRQTIFDNYDGADHQNRLEAVRKRIAASGKFDDDDASIFVASLEELNPRLFDVLHSAFRNLDQAETSEDFALIATAGRRFLTALANYLFPARKERYRNMDVEERHVKNRLYAYLRDRRDELDSVERSSDIERLEGKVRELYDFFSSELHRTEPQGRVAENINDLWGITAQIVSLNPEAARRPYDPYLEAFKDFIQQSAEDRNRNAN